MKFEDIIRKVSEEMDLPYDVCYRAYMSAWRFICMKAQELPLHEDMPEEEFSKLRTNFNLPSLGKLYISKDNFKRKAIKMKELKKLKKEKRDVENNED